MEICALCCRNVGTVIAVVSFLFFFFLDVMLTADSIDGLGVGCVLFFFFFHSRTLTSGHM